MRILLTCDPGIPVPPTAYGGIERIVDALVRYYQKEGHIVGLWADAGSTSPADFFPINNSPQSRGLRSSLQHARHLQKVVQTFRPDVLHSFSRLAYLLPLLPSPLPKVMSYQRHTGGINIRMARLLAGSSLCFTGCSDFICRMGSRAGGNWQSIPNFVELDRYTFVPELPDDAPLVFLSRVESIKGPDRAIQTALACNKKLIIAGNKPESGAELDFWNRKIEPFLNRDGIEWIGPVDDIQKSKLLGKAAALIVPIQWDEPFGIVFAEALACGTPVISCPRGALPEIIQDGKHGFLTETPEQEMEAVRKLPNLSRKECRLLAESHYSLNVIGPRYLSLYQELCY